MAFNLTHDHVLSILDATGKGDWSSFMESIDPDVRWWISSDIKDPLSKSGIYVRASPPKNLYQVTEELTSFPTLELPTMEGRSPH